MKRQPFSRLIGESTIVEVQRLLATIVLSVIGFLPVAGTLSNATAHRAELPACCRAHGKHKCALRLLEEASSSSRVDAGMYAVCAQFPYMPPATFAAANASVFPPKRAESFHAAIASQLAAQWQSEARVSAWFEANHPKRGPPHFLS